MIQVTPHMRIYVAKEPADFRKGIDGMAAVCRQILRHDVYSGAVFVFRNRVGTMIRLLGYDGQGLWLMSKRLSEGRFPAWRTFDAQDACQLVRAHELQVLLAAGDWSKVRAPKEWRAIAA
jgi:transposase